MRLPWTRTTASAMVASDFPSNKRAALIAVTTGAGCARTSAVAATAVSASATMTFRFNIGIIQTRRIILTRGA